MATQQLWQPHGVVKHRVCQWVPELQGVAETARRFRTRKPCFLQVMVPLERWAAVCGCLKLGTRLIISSCAMGIHPPLCYDRFCLELYPTTWFSQDLAVIDGFGISQSCSNLYYIHSGRLTWLHGNSSICNGIPSASILVQRLEHPPFSPENPPIIMVYKLGC